MTVRLPVRRTSGHVRAQRRVRRASPRLAPVRAGGALVMLGAVLVGYGLTASPAFDVRQVEFAAAPHYTSAVDVRALLGVGPDGGPNVFRLGTDALAARLKALPAVEAVQITARLPDVLRIELSERQPIMTWLVGDRPLLVDAGGSLFAVPETGPGAAVPAGLPTVVDRRTTAAGLRPGDLLDTVDLDVATRLASLKPADLGSVATGFAIAVDDGDGFTLKALPGGWTAVFGFYAPDLRSPDIVPGQVRLLRSLLAGRERTVARVVLASDRNGTYTTR
ncbi:MAG: cell division protein FtsQ/DivIB [Candidatus Limnocylindrales bacterium]